VLESVSVFARKRKYGDQQTRGRFTCIGSVSNMALRIVCLRSFSHSLILWNSRNTWRNELLGRPKCRWEINIKSMLEMWVLMVCTLFIWLKIRSDRDLLLTWKWTPAFRISSNYLASWMNRSFSKRILPNLVIFVLLQVTEIAMIWSHAVTATEQEAGSFLRVVWFRQRIGLESPPRRLFFHEDCVMAIHVFTRKYRGIIWSMPRPHPSTEQATIAIKLIAV
jgi:hypothetical protein